ncbi:hypothetical protein T4A_13822 [Trichinella pseudospiralis]|uniref:Uncharacterized protein n=1 Tax=Trichinella pseudospiralis TaxID=6337 RepID=A0A0V1EZU7_TRIPS|nr:hypothetical protein T4A_13822 [Trichinella pseudospiralis]
MFAQVALEDVLSDEEALKAKWTSGESEADRKLDASRRARKTPACALAKVRWRHSAIQIILGSVYINGKSLKTNPRAPKRTLHAIWIMQLKSERNYAMFRNRSWTATEGDFEGCATWLCISARCRSKARIPPMHMARCVLLAELSICIDFNLWNKVPYSVFRLLLRKGISLPQRDQPSLLLNLPPYRTLRDKLDDQIVKRIYNNNVQHDVVL